jgi:hypothetical protein
MFIPLWCGFPVDSDNETIRSSLTAVCAVFTLHSLKFTRLFFIWSILDFYLQTYFCWCLTYIHITCFSDTAPPQKKKQRKCRQALCVKSRNICINSKPLPDVIILFDSKTFALENKRVWFHSLFDFFHVPKRSWKIVTLGYVQLWVSEQSVSKVLRIFVLHVKFPGINNSKFSGHSVHK